MKCKYCSKEADKLHDELGAICNECLKTAKQVDKIWKKYWKGR